jgi:hypothetical protein
MKKKNESFFVPLAIFLILILLSSCSTSRPQDRAFLKKIGLDEYFNGDLEKNKVVSSGDESLKAKVEDKKEPMKNSKKINFKKTTARKKLVGDLTCNKAGAKKIILLNTNHGSYALNGAAIDWVESNEKQNTSITGSDGGKVKYARDFGTPDEVYNLIQEGLKLCPE